MYKSERDQIEQMYWEARDQVRSRLLAAIDERRRKLTAEKEGGDIVSGECSALAAGIGQVVVLALIPRPHYLSTSRLQLT